MPKKQKERKGKKIRKKHPKHLKSTLYEAKENAIERKRRSCPKCGAGILLAEHNNRLNCGKCGYTEFKSKTAEPKQTEATQEKTAETKEAPKEEKAAEHKEEKVTEGK